MVKSKKDSVHLNNSVSKSSSSTPQELMLMTLKIILSIAGTKNISAAAIIRFPNFDTAFLRASSLSLPTALVKSNTPNISTRKMVPIWIYPTIRFNILKNPLSLLMILQAFCELAYIFNFLWFI